MAFKMKQSPVKGKLSDFFKGLDSRLQATGKKTQESKAKRKKASVGDDGLTSMQRSRAEKKSRKPGESKFQADSRKMGEKKRADKKASKAAAASSIKGEDFGNKNREKRTTSVPKGNGVVINIKETPAKPKAKPKTKLTRKQQYDKKGWKYDDTIKGYNRDGSKKTDKKTDKKTKPGQVDLKTGNVNVDYAKKKK